MADALAESPHASGNNHYSGSPSVPSLSPTMQHRYKVPFILIETAENSSRSPPNTTLASAAVLFDSYEWIANPTEVNPSPGPQPLRYIYSPGSKYISVAAVPLNGHHTRVVTPTSNPPIFVPPKHTLFNTKDDILVSENVKLPLSVFWCLSEHDQHQSTASPRMHISTWENLINCIRRPSLIGIRMQQNYNGMSRALCQILLLILITHWAHEVIKWVSGWKFITLLHNNPQHIAGFGFVTLKIL
jgi:hypothetical protein